MCDLLVKFDKFLRVKADKMSERFTEIWHRFNKYIDLLLM